MSFSNGAELLAQCEEKSVLISQRMLDMEEDRGKQSRSEIITHMQETLKIMRNSCMEPLSHEEECVGHLIGGEGKRLMARIASGKSLLGGLVGKAVAYAMAVMEYNSAMGCVVAAPTTGSSGVMPGVLMALQDEMGFSDDQLVNGLPCAKRCLAKHPAGRNRMHRVE